MLQIVKNVLVLYYCLYIHNEIMFGEYHDTNLL